MGRRVGRISRGNPGGQDGLSAQPVRLHRWWADRARPGVLLRGLRPAGGDRDEAGQPGRGRPGESGPVAGLSDHAVAGPLRKRVRTHLPHRRRPGPAGQDRSAPRRAQPGLLQVQLQLVGAAQRHLRRGFLGTLGQRDRDRRGACIQRQLAVAAEQYPVPRTAAAVGARGPRPLVRWSADARSEPAGDAPVPRTGRAALPGHRHGLRRRLPHRPALLPPHRPGVRHPAAGGGQLVVAPGPPPLQGRRRVQPHGDLAAVHRLRQRPLHLRLGRRVHELRDTGKPVRHMLGWVGQRDRAVSGRHRHHGTRARLPAVGDGAGGRPRTPGRG